VLTFTKLKYLYMDEAVKALYARQARVLIRRSRGLGWFCPQAYHLTIFRKLLNGPAERAQAVFWQAAPSGEM
jgi:hypothetical protein